MEDIFANLPADPSVFDGTSGFGSAVDFDTDSVFLPDHPSMYTDLPPSSARSNPTPSPNENETPEHDYFSKPSPQLLSAAPTPPPPPPPPPSQPSPSPPPPPPPTQAHPPSQVHSSGPTLPPPQVLPPSQTIPPSQAIQQSRAITAHQALQQSQSHPSSQSSHPSSQPPPPPPTQPHSQAQVRTSQLPPPSQGLSQRQVAQSSGTQSRHSAVSSAALFAQQAREKQSHHHGHSPAASTASQPTLLAHAQPPPPPPTVAQPTGPTMGMHVKQQTATSAVKLSASRSGMDESTSYDSERLALRSAAVAIVADSWRAAAIPFHFVSSVCARLPSRSATNPAAVVEDSGLSPGLTSVSSLTDPSFDVWLLPPPSEGAILDALFSKIVNSEVPSTRLLNYLSHSLLTGIVSQRAVISTCLHWTGSTPGVSEQVLQAFTRFMSRIIPHYRFTFSGSDLTVEIKDFLTAFNMVINCTAKSPSLAPDLVSVLVQERVITLVRACARRIPTFWSRLHTSLEKLDSAPQLPSHLAATALPTQSAMAVAPYLKPLVTRLTYGLAVGITSLDTIAASIGTLSVPAQEAPIPNSLQCTFTIAHHVFGNDVAVALRELLSKREPLHGDLPALVKLERAAKIPGVNGTTHSSVSAKYAFRNNVQACEAIVRFIAERASVPDATEHWSTLWGGKDRLKRIIVNALPQVKTEIMSETGALIVAMAVTCCAAMCLGPALRIRDPNDGVEPRNANEAKLIQQQNEEVEDAVGELTSFAVFILEEAATAEETPSWRSFGLWLLLLMSRTGCLLRACGCDHVRAARVLRAWSGVPTGTPGTHTSHNNSGHKSNVHGNGSNNGTHQPSSSSNASQTEGISMFATSASLAIIDASDVSGCDETIQALCDDLVQ